MKELSREGHRERIRKSFIQNPDAEMNDIQILELFLTYAIPRKDVKPIAYALLNEFQTLENIFNADINELTAIDGIGEGSAILFKLNRKIFEKIEIQKVEKPKKFNNSQIISKYLIQAIGQKPFECFIAITLANNNDVINIHTIANGNANNATINKNNLVRKILNDHPCGVVIAHNHPKAETTPSLEDINTTIEMLNLLRGLGIKLHDHIIVNESEALSMYSDLRYVSYFD